MRKENQKPPVSPETAVEQEITAPPSPKRVSEAAVQVRYDERARPKVTLEPKDDMVMLEDAAERGNEAAFMQAAGEIDWSQRSAADFARAVRLALAAGAHLMARRLADKGHHLHADHEELAKMAHILAPPRVVRADLPPDPSVRANLEWMRAHAAEYHGRWVALKEGMLLASAPTARELRDQLPTTAGLFLARAL